MPPSLRSRWERTDAVRVSGEIKPTDVAPVIAPNSRGERAVYLNILVRQSRLSGVAGANLPVHVSHQKSYAAKGSLHE